MRYESVDTPMVDSTCPVCGRVFSQPADPGRRRLFDRPACRQKEWRARNAKTGHEAAQERRRQERQEEARREEQARAKRDRDAQGARERRARERARATASVPRWLLQRADGLAGDVSPRERRAAGRAAIIYARATHPNTPPAEADTCWIKLRADAKRYGWPAFDTP